VQVQLTSTQPASDNTFPAPAGQPIKMQFKVTYTCDASAFTNSGGAISLDFESPDEPHIPLTHVGGGVWEGTWTPVADPNKFPTEAVAVSATWQNGATPAGQTNKTFRARLTSGTSIPVIKPGGVVSAASPGTSQAVGLGGLVSIYGSQLASGTAGATAVPLPTELLGTQVLLQGKQLPLLYSSAGQINVQIPYDVTPNVQQTLTVRRGSALSASVSLAVSGVQPSIFLSTVAGQGVIVDQNGAITDPSNPAKAGAVVTIYCTGLGPVTPAVSSGVAATGPTSLVTPATITIGGQNAVIQYAGLTPGSPGLYQINAVVPQGISGDALPVIVTVGTQSSPAATIAVR
jgi:uncharacterized protein (TIGR03437 family)